MENNEKKQILCTSNFEEILAWLNSDTAAEPQQAEAFMTILHLKYMDKKGTAPIRHRRRTPINAEGLPSLKRLMAGIQNTSTTIANEGQKPLPVPIPSPENQPDPTAIKEKDDSPNTTQAEDEPKEQEERPVMKSSILGKAIRHCARLHGIALTVSHVQVIMYVLYGYRLANGSEDIFHEHPQMWKYGPVFPSCYNKLKKETDIAKEQECWTAVNRYDVKLGIHILNLVTGLGERRMRELTSKHTAPGTPWHDCKVANPEKWGSRISDESIMTWFKDQNKKNV